MRRTEPPGDSIDEPDQRCRDVVGRPWTRAERALRPDRPSPLPAAAPAADRGCGPARAGGGPKPGRASPPASPPRARATSPTVVIPRACSLAEVALPDAPQPFDRRADAGTPIPVPCRTTSRPSGLATPLATLARNFVRATPTVIGSPTRSRTRARNRAAISVGVPEIRPSPPTSRKASSIDRPSTSGVVSANTSNTALARLACTPPSGARPRWPPRTQPAGLRSRPSRCGRRKPWPRSWRRVPPPPRRSPAGRVGAGRLAARPTRRRRRGRRGGSFRSLTTNICSLPCRTQRRGRRYRRARAPGDVDEERRA